MDAENKHESEPAQSDYPTWFKVFAIFSALLIVGIILLLFFSASIAIDQSHEETGVFILLVAGLEGWVLFMTGSLYSNNKPISKIILQGTLMLVGIPFVAFWGCVLVEGLF